jgi:hypothetical protein
MTEKIKSEIKKTIKIFQEIPFLSYYYFRNNEEHTEQFRKILIDFAETVLKSQWVVGEDPPRSGYYLVAINGRLGHRYYNRFIKTWCDEFDSPINVTVWAPLPQPPEDV